MDTKHTPGPWELYNENSLSVYANVPGFGYSQIARANAMPCIGGSDDIAAERGMFMEQANARLIAASPTMYDALVEIAEKAPTAELQLIARAAIEKAKG